MTDVKIHRMPLTTTDLELINTALEIAAYVVPLKSYSYEFQNLSDDIKKELGEIETMSINRVMDKEG